MTRLKDFSLPEIRAQKPMAYTGNKASSEWYQTSEEYRKWERSDSFEFLWFRGRSGTGKTAAAAKTIELLDEREPEVVDVVAYFCSQGSLKTEDLLRSIIIQLGRRNESRIRELDNAQKSEMLTVIDSKNTIDAESLWGLFGSLLGACLDRKICLILDGINVMPPKEGERFARRLYRTWKEARSQSSALLNGRFCYKVLVTSHPNVELAEALENATFIDPDTEISG